MNKFQQASEVHTIPQVRQLFNCEVGLSDHTMGVGASVAAVAHGATVIEKHFTLSRAEGGVDSAFSMEPEEMKALVIETERAWQSLGRVTYGLKWTPSYRQKGPEFKLVTCWLCSGKALPLLFI